MTMLLNLLRWVFALAVGWGGVCSAQAATAYRVDALVPPKVISPTAGLVVPALNDDGRSAFGGKGKGGPTALLRGRPGSVPTPIAIERRFSRFGNVSISARGHVAFEASLEHVRGEGIFRGQGKGVTQIAGTRDAGLASLP